MGLQTQYRTKMKKISNDKKFISSPALDLAVKM
jgi:hypothetical protein